MVRVTERAKEVLLRRRAAVEIHDPRIGLRLTTQASGRVALVTDRTKAGDEVVTYKDATVLMVAPDVCAFLVGGRTIDCRQTGDGLQLVLTSTRGASREPAGDTR